MSATKEHYHNEIEAGMRTKSPGLKATPFAKGEEHPILFSTEMVKAILEGRKTMTRRVVKPQPKVINKNDFEWKDWCYSGTTEEGGGSFILQCPYGKRGDLLWVRETWKKDKKFPLSVEEPNTSIFTYFFKADKKEHVAKLIKWKPSIHMPKEAARIWLQVEEVRVERLQDISEEDAKAEGVKIHSRGNFYLDYVAEAFNTTQFIYRLPSAKQSFKTLWELINERRKNFIEKHGITWIDNPWVWVVKFKVLSTTGKPSFDSAQDDGSNGTQDDK